MDRYIVMVNIPFGIDDTYFCEYTGIKHDTLNEAYKELQKAKNDIHVIYATIERIST